ncbi:hypothetical protein E1265_22020 [Streptomyces sp. 8K308]|uniref:caspase, EACC1-associated type n=1 Tax=Streptomyces sp. 8K308 TaxID=2530388 RepID=UPI001050DBAB|nr:caspase family protein [Streptomyces sp. 8K308]TDC20488.1 hypothetical protein E1265_22020 [Streptomyces sp. 8K308]
MTDAGWPPLVPDAARAHLVVAGCAGFRHLPALPRAGADVAALTAALTGPGGLFAPELARTVTDPRRPADVLRLLEVGPKPDVLAFCYTGHGLKARHGRLVLALTDSVDEERQAAATGLPVEHVLDALRESGARHAVAILDCCYAERVFDAAGAENVHLLVAAGRTERAWSPPGAAHSRFSAALLGVLSEGVPEGPELLDLATIFRRLSVLLAPLDSEPRPPEAPHQSWPYPRQRAVNASGDLALARNPAFGTGRTAAGLAARARFASRVGRAGREGRPLVARRERLAQAERLFAAIARDAAEALPFGDRLRFRIHHAHASAVGEGGDPVAARRLLDALLKDWSPLAAPDDPWLRAARASHDHWSAAARG